jgi:hypothetical protein
MQALRTLSIVLSLATVLGTTSFPTTLVAHPVQTNHADARSAWTAADPDVGMCLPDPGALRP